MANSEIFRVIPKGRVVAIGDIHGNEAGFRQLLKMASLVNSSGDWVGGDTVLVMNGDIVGRGGNPRRIYAAIRRLSRQAKQAGGRLELLLGNHEALSMHDIHNYTTLQEYQDFAPSTAWSFDQMLREAYEDLPAPNPADSPLDLSQLHAEPLGWIELRRAMSPTGMVGRWLCQRNSIFIVGKTLFVHGGLHPKWTHMSLMELNRGIREELSKHGTYFDLNPKHPALAEDGPHWYRIGHRRPEEALRLELEEVFKAYDCDRMVVGHTPTYLHDPRRTGRVVTKSNGRLLCIDVGIGQAYGSRLGAIEMLPNGNVRAFYPDGEEML